MWICSVLDFLLFPSIAEAETHIHTQTCLVFPPLLQAKHQLLKKKNHSCCRAKSIKLKQHYSSLNCMSQIPDTTGIQKTLKISGKWFTKMGSILGEAKNVIYVQCCEIVKYVCMYVCNKLENSMEIMTVWNYPKSTSPPCICVCVLGIEILLIAKWRHFWQIRRFWFGQFEG